MAGVRLGYLLASGLNIALYFSATPFSFCNDKDDHVFREIDFYENMAWGLLLKPGLRALFDVNSRLTLEADVSYRHIQGLIGGSYAVGAGVAGGPENPPPGAATPVYPNSGGASFDALKASFLLSISL